MIVYHEIVFMQGEKASEALELLDESTSKCLDYLCEWDYGTEMEHSPKTNEPWGSSDHTIKRGRYVISYNTHVPYISLTRLERVNKKTFNK